LLEELHVLKFAEFRFQKEKGILMGRGRDYKSFTFSIRNLFIKDDGDIK